MAGSRSHNLFSISFWMKPFVFNVLLLIVASGCDKDKIVRTPEEEHILELAYADDFLYPEGFYHELIDTGSVYYENTVSIKPLAERDHIWIELNTSDKDEARFWSDKSNEYSSDNREVIGVNETDRYFEFKRKNARFARDILYSRIHKTTYFEPYLNKFSVTDTLVGKYNGDLNPPNVKELVEYLWSNGSTGLWHTKVLRSELKELSDYYEHYIKSIIIVRGDFGIHDEIYVYDNCFTLNKSNRLLLVKSREVNKIQGIGR